MKVAGFMVISLLQSLVEGNLNNVALSKNTTQSSVYYNSSYVVDGRTDNTDFRTITLPYDPDPYWEVNLQEDHMIYDVIVYNGSQYGELRQMYLKVSLGHTTFQLLAYYHGLIGIKQSIKPSKPTKARYLKITNGHGGPVVLIAVEVMAKKLNDSVLYNAALLKDTIQSTTNSYSSLAVDGKKTGYFFTDGCAHTRVADLNAFWEIDLGLEYTINHINIYNRRDCCMEQLSDFYIHVSSDQRKYVQFAYIEDSFGVSKTINADGFVSARWVKISMMNKDLYLCEVEIMSDRIVVKDHFSRITGAKPAVASRLSALVQSSIQCAAICRQHYWCAAVIFEQEMCHLVDSLESASSTQNISYYMVETMLL